MSSELGTGRIGTEHADALTHTLHRLDDDGRAMLSSLDVELAATYWLRADLDPESGARLFRAIDAETTALSKDSSIEESSDRSRPAARALVTLATSSKRATRPGRVELLALVDLDTLVDGLRDDSV